MTSEDRSNQPSRVPAKWLATLLLTLAIVGFIDATYLTAEHYTGSVPPCTLTHGCETVLTSSYATPFGIPLALFGALYYLALGILGISLRETRSRIFLSLITLISGLGFLMTLGLVYLQLFVLHAICLYCMTSALVTTSIFGFALWGYKTSKTKNS